MRIAFYAPLKEPEHPVPSGDRQMARLLIQALRAGGHVVDIGSTLRSFLPDPDPPRQTEVERAADAEARRIEAAWTRDGATPPDAWFTYHPFYKAPDLLGPCLARRFAIPYATAEASNAPKRAAGPWASWHAATESAFRAASVHFCFTDRDRAGLMALLGAGDRLVVLPPFIDPTPFAGRDHDAVRKPMPTFRHDAMAEHGSGSGRVHLVTVAMMRPGDKMRSFAFLAEALLRLPELLSWHLDIIGDGPARPEVEATFAPLGEGRVSFLGQLEAKAVGTVLRDADVYVWPGFNEAFGVAYLEAGAAGLPVLALCCGGIASVVRHGETGLLVPEGDGAAYARDLARLIEDAALRDRLGAAAKVFVTGERTVARAAEILGEGLSRTLRRLR